MGEYSGRPPPHVAGMSGALEEQGGKHDALEGQLAASEKKLRAAEAAAERNAARAAVRSAGQGGALAAARRAVWVVGVRAPLRCSRLFLWVSRDGSQSGMHTSALQATAAGFASL